MEMRGGCDQLIDVPNHIGGKEVQASNGEWILNYAPSTGNIISRIPKSNHQDVNNAVRVAKEAGEGWGLLSKNERADWLDRIADSLESRFDEIASLESMDTGKPIRISRAVDATRSVTNFRFYAKQIRELEDENFRMENATNHVIRRPVGVGALITPWNLPLYLLSWKVAPAIGMGNTVICKPSELTPMTANLMMQVIKDSGLPDGVVNLIHGTGIDAGAPLVSHPDVRFVSFTGGTSTGSIVARDAAASFKKISLELGGKNATIILDDCDLEEHMSSIVRASFLNQGQVCLCGSRILIQDSIYESFKNKFVEAVNHLKIGDPTDENTDLGSLISPQHLEKVSSYVDLAIEEGGTILTGGKTPEIGTEFEGGNWISPVVVEGLSHESRCATEEIFGPLVTLHRFFDDDEAVKISNNTRYGLAGSIWTKDSSRGEKIAKKMDTGMVWINTWLHRDLRVPFGGVKDSGVGREGGKWSLGFYSEASNICIMDD
tara:strand:+ start:4999 stop:6468 length:1470 start_codon:yes stop_codon:yes gene_type:complete